MSEKMSWVFEGVDRFTGPVGGMSTSVIKLAFGLNEVHELLQSVGEALAFVGEKGYHFAELGVDALAFKEATLNSFETILGTRKEAHEMFNEAQAFADLTPFKTHDVIEAFQGLSSVFKKEEVPIVFQAVADVASFAGTKEKGQEVLNSMMADLQRVQAFGKANMRDIMPLLSAGRIAGLSMDKWLKSLASVMGTDVATATAKFHAGMVGSNDAVVAFLRTVKGIEKGPLGSAVIKQATTLNGLFSTSQSLVENFFTTMSNEAEDIPGIKSFKGFLTNVIGYFNVLGPTGKRVAADVETIFNGLFQAVFGKLAGDGGMDLISTTMEKVLGFVESVDWEGVFGSILTTVTTVGRVLYSTFSGFMSVVGPAVGAIMSLFGMANSGGDLADTFSTIGKVLGVVVGGLLVAAVAVSALTSPIFLAITALVAWGSAIRSLFDVDWSYIPEQLGDLATSVGSFFTDLWGSFKEWGAHLIAGLIEGITSKATHLASAVGDVVSGMTSSFTSLLGIASPSTVFAGYGENTIEGYQQGFESGMPDVSSAFDGLLGEREGGAGSSIGSSFSVTFAEGAFTIDARGGMDAETFARRLQEILPGALAPALERIAIQAGG